MYMLYITLEQFPTIGSLYEFCVQNNLNPCEVSLKETPYYALYMVFTQEQKEKMPLKIQESLWEK